MTISIGGESMSWISDGRDELKALDASKKRLRTFGITVGIVFLILSGWVYFNDAPLLFICLLGAVGLTLILGGVLFPNGLAQVYRVWMGFAFAIGWAVSRVILAILFYFVVTPIGLVARLVGKEFMDINMKKTKDSYWIPKRDSEEINYEKMY